jgi:glycosyltransferase involved in cell wall biosynthesis
MTTLVSMLMPVYNRERYVAEAIESILAQSYRPLEIVVVDDGSTDRSAEIARRYAEVRYAHQPHAGIAGARNQTLALARGRYLGFLDSDDLWEPGALARQMEVMLSTPELDMLFGHVREFRSPELDPATAAKLRCHPEPMPSRGPGAIIRAEVFHRVGQFRTDWKVGEFIDWYARATEQGVTSQMLPDVVCRRRVHGANQSFAQPASRADYLKILKASLDRRRDDQR